MKWHISFWDLSEEEAHHKTTLIEAENLEAAKEKVESFCEVHFGFLFQHSFIFEGEINTFWDSDSNCDIKAKIDGEDNIIGKVYLITNEQRKVNKDWSLSGGRTEEGGSLLADIIASEKSGFTTQQIRGRIHEEYESWIIEELRKDLLIEELRDSANPAVIEEILRQLN